MPCTGTRGGMGHTIGGGTFTVGGMMGGAFTGGADGATGEAHPAIIAHARTTPNRTAVPMVQWHARNAAYRRVNPAERNNR